MRDLDPAQLRRLAADSAKRSQRQWKVALLAVHGFVYVAAILSVAAIALTTPGIYNALLNSIDLDVMVFGLFFGWGIGLGLHGATLAMDSAWMERRLREGAASSVVGRALLEDEDESPAQTAKAKRDLDALTEYALEDDGEITVAESDEHSPRRASH
jgi:hypothetical protein